MKKILVLIMALVLMATLVTLVACGDEGNTSTPASTSDGDVTTTTSEDTSSTSSTPDSTPNQTVESTPGSSSTEPAVTEPEPTPIYRDSAKVYHVEQTVVKTNSKDLDRDETLACHLYYSSAGVNMNERYADHSSFIVYEVDCSGMIEPSFTFKVRQQYAIYIIDSDEILDYPEMIEVANFNDIADQYPSTDFNENGAYVAGANTTDITINPYEHGYYGVFYIWIANCNPEHGWGGTVMQYTINQYVEGEGEEITEIDNSQGVPNYKPTDAIQESIEITVNGYGDDEAYIFENTASANDTRRYCDATSYLIYRIDLRKMYEPTVELLVTQNYKVEISPDGKSWVEIANFGTSQIYNDLMAADPSKFNASGDYLEPRELDTIVIDPYNPTTGEPLYGNLYIRISDCFVTAGWGGAIEKLTIKHYGLVSEE